jgi:3alpha(or 20beta)-hydroxysteroid dehydrogenase
LVADRAGSSVKAVAERLGPAADYVVLDMRSREDWAAAVDTCRTQFGAPPDILLNTAGVMVGGLAATAADEDMKFAYGVNVQDLVNGIQAAHPRDEGERLRLHRDDLVDGRSHLRRRQHDAVQREQGRCCGCGPARRWSSVIRYPGQRPHSGSDRHTDVAGAGVTEEFFANMPIPRMGQPRDIAQAALFLAGEESSWITGTKFQIDGGMDAGPVLS